ncbi:MAG: glycoside hydrolase [Gemmatimonadetes bacterium]|nr:glycoside hydrolase [Gemmatimonadota bacterium]
MSPFSFVRPLTRSFSRPLSRLSGHSAVRVALAALALAATAVPTLEAQTPTSPLFSELRWRHIGPFRAGRTKAATGVRQQPNVFYIAAVNGGAWRTTDYGRTWTPIFDGQPSGSIGALAVAPSDPNIIYIGSGEGLQRPDLSTGDGIYKSTDAGKTWAHLGLRDGQQIPQIVIDPRNPDRLFVAVLGHPYGPNEERGLYRSLDGGRTFKKILGKDENTGAIDIVMAPDDPNTLYAALWEARQGPWENGVWQGPGTGLFKSTDGGDSWTPIMNGLPTPAEGLGRIGIATSASRPQRLYVTIDAGDRSGIYRSDNAGASWAKTSTDERVHNRGSDFAEVKVDPKNADVVYSGSIVTWKSVDAGVTWKMIRGAPGGDDYHRIWINPDNPDIILIAADQGAIITVNGGDSWSSWYNQPTAQFYHVTTDNSFPYRVCGGQQESGSACVQSRGNDGQLTFREWRPVGVEEYGYVAPDPLDPNIMYGGKVTKFDYRTGQTQNVAPKPFRDANYRMLRTAPILFAPTNPRKLYFGANTIWQTIDGGNNWTEISPDLTRQDSVVPPNVGKYATERSAKARHPGVVYTIAPSYRRENVIWAGSDDGLIHVTMNGGRTWKNVTPPELVPWAKVSLMDAGHFDTLTAYAAINTLRLDDLRPHIFRTHDGGKSWQRIVTGIDSGATINVVREDPRRKGLLYAGSETKVWVSFDDGDHWEPLQVNMPATSIRDLVIKDDDLVVGTHGRGFWILDDISPLREWADRATSKRAHLFKPALATRVRYSMYTDTPLPVDEPRAENPPDGAILHYSLERAASSLALEIVDASGAVVRRYEKGVNADPDPRAEGHWPDWWIRPSPVLSAEPGMHRFVWDLRHARPRALSFSYPISAIPGQTVPEPLGPFALPGRYTVRLTVDGTTYSQPLVVRMDPRVKTAPAGIQAQHALALRLHAGIDKAADGIARVRQLQEAARAAGNATRAAELGALVGAAGGFGGRGGGPSLSRVSGALTQLLDVVDGADYAPTAQVRAAATATLRELEALLGRVK